MALNEFQRVSYKMLGGIVARRMDLSGVHANIQRGRIGIRAEAYVAYSAVIAAGVFFFAMVATAFFVIVLVPQAGIAVSPAMYVLVVATPVLLGGATFGAMWAMPGSRANKRAKDIDRKLPYALNYIAAMASAGVNIDRVFKSLSEQTIYGAVADEAGWIYRDIVLFGRDSVTALRRAVDRSPSGKFGELLQGAITTVTSGGDLQGYFSAKAQRYMWDNKQEQKQFVEMMGLMAETYVTAAVAGPLFLIVMMAIMGMLGGGGPEKMYAVVYLLLPVANLGFVFGMKGMIPEV